MQENIISFAPVGGDLYSVVYAKEPTSLNPRSDTAQLEKIFAKEPYNFEIAFELAKRYTQDDQLEKACEVRFQAASEAINAIPEEEEFLELDWDDPENQEFVEIIVASGIDFYMHGDFEMAAALFESAMSLDNEDHSDIASQLALSYLAIEDFDGYEMLKNDFAPGSMVEALIENFAAFIQKRKSALKLPQELITEIISAEHLADEAYFAEADKERVSKDIAARELWYRHIPIFEVYPEFTERFKK